MYRQALLLGSEIVDKLLCYDIVWWYKCAECYIIIKGSA